MFKALPHDPQNLSKPVHVTTPSYIHASQSSVTSKQRGLLGAMVGAAHCTIAKHSHSKNTTAHSLRYCTRFHELNTHRSATLSATLSTSCDTNIPAATPTRWIHAALD